MKRFRKAVNILTLVLNVSWLGLTTFTCLSLDALRELCLDVGVYSENYYHDVNKQYDALTDTLIYGVSASMIFFPFCLYVLISQGFRVASVMGHLMHASGYALLFFNKDTWLTICGAGLIGCSTALTFNGHSSVSKLVPPSWSSGIEWAFICLSSCSMVVPQLIRSIGLRYLPGDHKIPSSIDNAHQGIVKCLLLYILLCSIICIPVVFMTTPSSRDQQVKSWDDLDNKQDSYEDSSSSDGTGSSCNLSIDDNRNGGTHLRPPPQVATAGGTSLWNKIIKRYSSSSLAEHESLLNKTSGKLNDQEEEQQSIHLLAITSPNFLKTKEKNWRNQARSPLFLSVIVFSVVTHFLRTLFFAFFRDRVFETLGVAYEQGDSLLALYNWMMPLAVVGSTVVLWTTSFSIQVMYWLSAFQMILIHSLMLLPSGKGYTAAAFLFCTVQNNIYSEIFYIVNEMFGRANSNFLQGIVYVVSGVAVLLTIPFRNYVVYGYLNQDWIRVNWISFGLSLILLVGPISRLSYDMRQFYEEQAEEKSKPKEDTTVV